MYKHWGKPWRYHDNPCSRGVFSLVGRERCINKQVSCYVLSSSTGVSTGDSRCKKEVHNLCLGDRRLLRGEISYLRPEGSEELVQQNEKRSKQSDQFVMPRSERAFIHSFIQPILFQHLLWARHSFRCWGWL